MITFQNLYLGKKDSKAKAKPSSWVVVRWWNSRSLFPYLSVVFQFSEGRKKDPKKDKKNLSGLVFSRLSIYTFDAPSEVGACKGAGKGVAFGTSDV